MTEGLRSSGALPRLGGGNGASASGEQHAVAEGTDLINGRDIPVRLRPYQGSGRYSTTLPAADPDGGTTANPVACARPRSIADPHDGSTSASPS